MQKHTWTLANRHVHSPVHNLLDEAGARVLPEAEGNAQQEHMQPQHLAPHDRCVTVVILRRNVACTVQGYNRRIYVGVKRLSPSNSNSIGTYDC